MSSTAPQTSTSSPRYRRGRILLLSFLGTLGVMAGAAVAALRTAPTSGGVSCGNVYALTSNVGTVNWTAAPWSVTSSTGAIDSYPGQTVSNDCATIYFSTVQLTGTDLTIAALNITATSGTPELQVGTSGTLNVTGTFGNLTGISSTQVGSVQIDGGGVFNVAAGIQNVGNFGEIFVNGGTLKAMNPGEVIVGSGGRLTVGVSGTGTPGGTVLTDHNGITIAAGGAADIYEGLIQGGGALTVGDTSTSGFSSMFVGNPGPVTIDNTTIVVEQNGTLRVVEAPNGPTGLANGGAVNVLSGGILELNAFSLTSPRISDGGSGGPVNVQPGGLLQVWTDVMSFVDVPVNNSGTVDLASSSGGALHLNGGGTHNGTIQTIVSSQSVTLNGTHSFQSGVIAGPGLVTNTGTADLSGTDVTIDGTKFTNSSTMLWTGTGNLIILNGGVLDIPAGGLLDIQTSATDPNISADPAMSSIINNGTIRKGSAGNFVFFQPPVTTSGVVEVLGGGLAFMNGGSGSGTWDIGSAGQMWLGGGTFTLTAPPTFPSGGPLVVNGATLNLSSSLAAPWFVLSSGSVVGDFPISVPAGGLFYWTAGSVAGNSSLDIAAGGVLSFDATANQLLTDRDINSFGDISFSSAGVGHIVQTNDSDVVNQPGAMITILGTGGFVAGGGTGQSLLNDGVIVKDNNVGAAPLAVPVMNNGVIEIRRGIIDVPQGYTQTTAGNLALMIAGTTLGSQYSQLAAGSAAISLAGALYINNIFIPAAGDVFTILTHGARTGDFATKNGLTYSGGALVYSANAADITLTATTATSPLIVTNLNDSGTGSLRQALSDAAAGLCLAPCEIQFNIPTPGPIDVLSPLPIVSTPLFINGTSQPGYSGTPLVAVNGGPCSRCDGLTLQGNSEIRGLAVYGFTLGGAVWLEGSTGSNTLSDSWIGIDLAGNPAPNDVGVFLDNGGNNQVANNKIGNNTYGVAIFATSPNNMIINNAIFQNTTGIAVEDGPAIGNLFYTNSIYANSSIGIDLGVDGPTADDPNDTDTGANNLQNTPIIGSATLSGGVLSTVVTVDSALANSQSLKVQLFKADVNGQGETFLGEQCFATNFLDNQTMNVPAPGLVGGDLIVGTATGWASNDCSSVRGDGTSEFGNALAAVCTPPSVTLTAPASMCAGTSATAGATSISGATYVWTVTNGTLDSGQGTPSISFTAGASGSVGLDLLVTNDCGATTNPTATITIGAATATITASGPTTFCQGSSVTLTANSGTSYLWSTGETTQSITVTGSGDYTVTVSQSGGCTATSAPTTVTVLPAPSASISGPTAYCAGQPPITLTVNGTGLTGIVWSTGATTSSISVSPSTTTNYTATVTGTNGCTKVLSHTVNVNNAGPPLTVIAPSSVVALSSGNVATVSEPPPGLYTWVIINGTLDSGQGGPSITFTAGESGSVQVLVTVESGGCSATGGVYVPIDSCATTPPSLVSPAESESVSSPVTFSWNPVPNAIGYDVWRVAEGSRPAFVGSTAAPVTTLTAPLPSGSFDWYVEAKLEQVCDPSRTTSEVRRVTVTPATNCPTAAPVIIGPSGISLFSPVTFQWTGVADAIGYRVMASLDGLPATEIDTVPPDVTQLLAAVPVGTVTWWVEAHYSGCSSVASARVTFQVELEECFKHEEPALVAPPNGMVSGSSNVTFSWSAVAGADGYAVWLENGADRRSVGTTLGDLSLAAFVDPGVYDWFVEAKFEGCPSTESARRRIEVPASSSCPQNGPALIQPPDGDTVSSPQATFAWSAVPNALSYELWVSLASGSDALIESTTATSLTAELPEGESEWFVRARIDRCSHRDSSRRTIRYQPPAGCSTAAPQLLLPLDDGRPLTSPTTFRWTAVPGATQYNLYLARGNATPQLQTTTTQPQATDIVVPNGESRWFVEAVFGGCPLTRSSAGRFVAVPRPQSCVTLAAPVISVPGQVSADTSFTVQWTSVPGAESYLLTEYIGAESRTLAIQGQSASFVYPNNSGEPITYVYRVSGVDSDCNPSQPGLLSDALGVSILPVRANEASAVVGSLPAVLQIIPIGPEFAGQSFVATSAQPWVTIAPSSGVVPAGGIDLVVTADVTDLPLGTSIAGVTITFGTAGRVAANGSQSSKSTTVSVNLVTPVTPTPKSSPPPDALIIPAVAHAQGVNAVFRSDVRVSNTSPQIMKYQVTFVPTGTSGMTQGRQTTLDIQPGRTVALDDILRTWFGTGTANVLGTLEIRPLTQSSSSTSSAAVRGVPNFVTFASSRTFNQTENGTFGTYIPAIPFANFVGGATAASPSPATLSMQQISQSLLYRTNLGLVEGTGNPVQLLVSVFNGAGGKVDELQVDLNGGEHLQMGSFLYERGIELEDGRVEVKVTSGSGKVTAYAAVTNNATGDSLVVTPSTLGGQQSTKYVLPGVAELSGGVVWQTDVRLFNAGDEPVTATLTLHSLNNNPPQQTTLELPPGQIRQLDRVLATLFGLSNDGGALHVETAGGSSLIATARTYRPAGDGANFGQFIQAVTPDQAVGVGSRPLHILQVEESPRFRSNVGIAEVTGNPATVELTIIPPDSKVSARLQVEMGPNQFRQLNSLLAVMGLTNTHNARVAVRVLSGQGRVTAYAATIDEITHDPTFIPAQ